jgi:alpha-methylacyl-CoA racemase
MSFPSQGTGIKGELRREGPHRHGPLTEIRVIEFAGIGPVPFAGMLLADLGAEIVRIERPGGGSDVREAVNRGRTVVYADLKNAAEVDSVVELCSACDVIMEGFRPGVMERLGLGPERLLAANSALIYGRMTGWGQSGPLRHAAGHDINYIAISGALAAIGTAEKPIPPLNLVGDYGGGALYFVMGLLAALVERSRSGAGQIVDVAMCDGAASLVSLFSSMAAIGTWQESRASNIVDGGAPYYDTYRCKDGNFIAIGAIEPQFYQELLSRLGIEAVMADNREDKAAWPAHRAVFAEVFAGKTRDEWCEVLEGTDVCFAPALTMSEAPAHRHHAERNTFGLRHGILQPNPVPRYSRSACRMPGDGPSGLSVAEIARIWRSDRRIDEEVRNITG